MAQFHEQLLNRPDYSTVEPGTLSIGRPKKVRTLIFILQVNKPPKPVDDLSCIPQIKTKKVGRPASSATKKSIGRLAKDRKGRKALGSDSTVTTRDQDRGHSSDEDDNPGDMDMSSDEEEGESEIELGPTFEMDEAGLAGETHAQGIRIHISLPFQPSSSPHLSYM